LEILDLHLVIELVEPKRVYSAPEATSLRLDLESGETHSRFAALEPSPQGLVDHTLETLATASSLVLKLLRQVVVQRQGRPHEDIMMPLTFFLTRMLCWDHL
jgi:hypothetical protein